MTAPTRLRDRLLALEAVDTRRLHDLPDRASHDHAWGRDTAITREEYLRLRATNRTVAR